MKSSLFYTDKYKEIERKVAEFLNSRQDYLSTSTVESTRAVGDAMQDILADSFPAILGSVCAQYSANFARRSMADLAFEDQDGFYYIVDVKTHRLDTKFNMPNLTSVERIARFYEDDKSYFVVLFINYRIEGIKAVVEEVHFVPIEFLSWNCLTIGALGWGQIQIANSNIIEINPGYSRKKWMLELCDALLEFYPKEIEKISYRIERFREIRDRWAQKPESIG
ncbi:MAG TPA: hypothetical protein GX506_02570 [Firmicutes bacterium]|nr:hypothetical protein [Bacillota bacterium]